MEVKLADVGRGITLAYEERGDESAPPLLLIMGLGVQMLGWRDGFCDLLAERGLRVVRFDNRDVGESTHLHDAGMPHLAAIMSGDAASAPYRLEDMAADVLGLLDHLGLESAHLVGASMGGMIAQTVTATAPERVRSLTSIMSTTGDRAASQPTEAAMAVLFHPSPRTADEAEERAVAVTRVIGSPGYPFAEDDIRATARQSFERAHDPAGFARQLAAIHASGDRTEVVRGIRTPTLVIHGVADQLVPVAGGRATAAAVEGAELIEFEGMGHDLPRDLWPRFVDAIAHHVERAERDLVPAGR